MCIQLPEGKYHGTRWTGFPACLFLNLANGRLESLPNETEWLPLAAVF
jgi:hypothetical protein